MEHENCCQVGLRTALFSKFGRCRKCIRLSATGALIGWCALAGTILFSRSFWFSAIIGLVATGFSVLFAAHLFALGTRMRRDRRLLMESRSEGESRRHGEIERRDFLAGALRVGAAGLAAVLFGRTADRAWAQAGASVAGTVVNQKGKPCPGFPVVLYPNPPCELVPPTTHRKAMCRQNTRRENPVLTYTDRNGAYTFNGVQPNSGFVVCLCGGSCRFVGGVCQLRCNGDSTPTASGAAGTTAAVPALTAKNCNC